MPELPEVQRVLMSLEPHVRGARVARALLRRRDICQSFSDGRVRRTTPGLLLAGQTILGLERHGKQLAIHGSAGGAICIHLGMSGQLLWTQGRPRLTHMHLLLELNGPGDRRGWVVFRDPRRFGGVWTFESMEQLRACRWNGLGPDALELTGQSLERALGSTGRPIKAALLDQRVVAGIGNIYADEALFRAGIKPQRKSDTLSQDQLGTLARALRDALSLSIAAGGTTLRDYLDGNGQAGGGRMTLLAYGRGGQPCTRCGTRLRSGQVAQRTTVWCPKCQR
jgi:formamidopyrimidine-DNA glycosylase